MSTLQYNATKNNGYGASSSSSDPYFSYQTYNYSLSEGTLGNMSVTSITGCSLSEANTNGSSSTGVWRMQIEALLNGSWYALGYIQVNSQLSGYQTFNAFTSTAGATTKSLMGKYALAGVRGKVINGYFYVRAGSQIILTATAAEDYTASTFSCSPATVDAGSTVTINISRMSADLTHAVQLVMGTEVATYTGVGTSQAHTIPLSWLYQMTDAQTKPCSVTVHTYAGAQLIGSVSGSFTVHAGDAVKPTLTSLTPTPVNGYWGLYVQGYSKAQLTANGAAGAYGSIIVGVSIAGGTTNPTVTGVLNTAGNNTFYATVTDSRGRISDAVSCTVNVTQYAPPFVSSLTVARAVDSNGAFSDEGKYCKVTPVYSWSAIGSNTRIMTVDYQLIGAGSWASGSTDVIASGNPVVLGTGETFATDASYSIRLTITDSIAPTVVAYATLPTSTYVMDFKALGTGVAFGQVAIENGVTISPSWPFYANGSRIGVPSNTNILINGNFRYFINQRGLTDYTTHGGYTVDRWQFISTGAGGHLYSYATNDYIHLYASPTSETYLIQWIENPKSYIGDFTLTFYAAITGGTMGIYGNNGTGWIGHQAFTGNQGYREYSTTFTLDGTQTSLFVAIYSLAGGTVAIKWAKLEAGKVATPFCPRLYKDELALCQRYYLNIPADSVVYPGLIATSGNVTVSAYTPTTMRIIPTVNTNAFWSIRFNGNYYNSVTSYSVDRVTPNSVRLVLVYTPPFPSHNACAVTINSGGLQLDAEMY